MFETYRRCPPPDQEFGAWTWEQIAPYYDDLQARAVSADTVDAWLLDWTSIGALVDELNTWYSIATTVNTADTETQNRYANFLDNIQPQAAAAEQRLKEKLLASGLEPAGFAAVLRKMRTDAALYREANAPLLADLRKLDLEYDAISGARTVIWEGQEATLSQVRPAVLDPDRDRRERAYRTMPRARHPGYAAIGRPLAADDGAARAGGDQRWLPQLSRLSLAADTTASTTRPTTPSASTRPSPR